MILKYLIVRSTQTITTTSSSFNDGVSAKSKIDSTIPIIISIGTSVLSTTVPIATPVDISVPTTAVSIAMLIDTTVIIVLLIVTGLVCIITIYCKYRTPSTTAEQEDTSIIITDIPLADNVAYHVHVQESHIPLTNTEVYYINIQEIDIPVADNEAYDMRIAAITSNDDLLYDEIMIMT